MKKITVLMALILTLSFGTSESSASDCYQLTMNDGARIIVSRIARMTIEGEEYLYVWEDPGADRQKIKADLVKEVVEVECPGEAEEGRPAAGAEEEDLDGVDERDPGAVEPAEEIDRDEGDEGMDYLEWSRRIYDPAVIDQLGQERYVKCSTCGGTGRVDCPFCNDGKMKHPLFPEELVCPHCDGKGRLRCRTCGGRGRIDTERQPQADEVCEACEGEGQRDCPLCVEGVRRLINGMDVRCYYCRGTGVVPCTYCDGTGRR